MTHTAVDVSSNEMRYISGRFTYLRTYLRVDVVEAATEQEETDANDTNNTSDTVPSETTQESPHDLPADEKTPEESVSMRTLIFKFNKFKTNKYLYGEKVANL